MSSSRRSCVGTSETPVTPCSSMTSAVPSASNPGWMARLVPYIAHRTVGASPPMWYIGRQHSHRSSGSTPRRKAEATALQTRFPTVSRTPFGIPVVPEVNMTTAVTDGERGTGPCVSPSTPVPVPSRGPGASRSTPVRSGGSTEATGPGATSRAVSSVSRPQTSTSTSARRAWPANVSAGNWTLSGTSVRPVRIAAWTSVTNATRVPRSVPTGPPWPRVAATPSTTRSSSRYVQAVPSAVSTSAVRSGVTAARWERTSRVGQPSRLPEADAASPDPSALSRPPVMAESGARAPAPGER